MHNLYRRFKRVYKLTAMYFLRIIFVKNKFSVGFFTKMKANLFGGYLADQWVLYDFDNNNKSEYLSEFDWYRSRYINEPFDFMLNNKVVATEILQQYVRVAKSYVIKNRGILTDFESNELNYEEVINLIKREKKVFIKPYGTGKGKGVFIITYSDNRLCIDNVVNTEEEVVSFLKEQDNWFISEALEQAEYANQLYDKTTNTIRLITMRDIVSKEFKVFFAVQRIGTSQTIPVDNGSRGGLVSKIDIHSGEMSEARSLHSLDVHTVHPDSGGLIKGVVIPQWDEIKSTVLDLAKKMPYMHFIAWDILLTDEGVSIVEANTSSGVNIIQLWGGQRNGELGDFYRYHKVIK